MDTIAREGRGPTGKELKPKEAELVRALLKIPRPDFLYAARQARQALGGVWFEFLREALDIRYENIDESSLELARSSGVSEATY